MSLNPGADALSAHREAAFIAGITGQDGAYVTELLLAKGYEVHGIERRRSFFDTDHIKQRQPHPHDPNERMTVHCEDLTDSTNLVRTVQQVQPDKSYSLAGRSLLAVRFEQSEYAADTDLASDRPRRPGRVGLSVSRQPALTARLPACTPPACRWEPPKTTPLTSGHKPMLTQTTLVHRSSTAFGIARAEAAAG